MDLPRVRSTRHPSAVLDDLLLGPLEVEVVETVDRWYNRRGQLTGEVIHAIETGRRAATTALQQPDIDSALAEVAREIATLRADSDARRQLEGALEHVVRPAIVEATAAGMGVLIAYGPDECVARPSNAVPRGTALLLRTDRLSTLLTVDPIPYQGANR